MNRLRCSTASLLATAVMAFVCPCGYAQAPLQSWPAEPDFEEVVADPFEDDPWMVTEPSLWVTPGPLSASQIAAAEELGFRQLDELRPGQSEEDPVQIPEPLLFDMVRPLGARRGELEFNTLAIFPFRRTGRATRGDPFGPAPTSRDLGGIEWAPEVEYAPVDNFAIEFEYPFEDGTLQAYKLGMQWTLGTAFDNRFIHGFQVLTEPTPEFRNWNSALLYLAGIRFDETYSMMLMFGGRANLEGPGREETFEKLINASLFADITEDIVLGIETNYATRMDGTSQFIVLPQAHLELTRRIELQCGIGAGFSDELNEQSFIMRAIYVP